MARRAVDVARVNEGESEVTMSPMIETERQSEMHQAPHFQESGQSPGRSLLSQHLDLLRKSDISDAVAGARGYWSATEPQQLAALGFASSQAKLVPALVIPIHGVTGDIALHQIRPDRPREIRGRAVKYETPKGAQLALDVPPMIRDRLRDPSVDLYITEGARKADSAVSHGLVCIALPGVWAWKSSNILAEWDLIALKGRTIYLAFDSDVMTKVGVQAALVRLKAVLERFKAIVKPIYLPATGDTKVGLDDFFASGHDPGELLPYVSDDLMMPAAFGPYRVAGGRICREKQTKTETVVLPLSNFVAQIVEEIIVDDGQETQRSFELEGVTDSGLVLPRVRVPADRFSAMAWPTETWGNRAVIYAGHGTRDYLRDAIQRMSDAPERHIFAHTGWRKIGGAWVYLYAGGAVGRDEVEVDLGADLADYTLPAPVTGDELREAVRASLRLWDVAPREITVPLWAAVWTAAVAHFLRPNFTLWLEGRTGSMKSTLAALFLSHFGSAWSCERLPSDWSSTANQLEKRAFTVKDAMLVIDEYVPRGHDAKEQEIKAARVIRAQGNLSTRDRLRSDLTERQGYRPRGLIVGTGELHPRGESLLARMLVLPMEPKTANEVALTASQTEAARGQMAQVLVGFVQWIGPQWETLNLRDEYVQARAAFMEQGIHRRVPGSVAHLWVGLTLGLQFAQAIGAIDGAEHSARIEAAEQALAAVGSRQARMVESERPTLRYLSVLMTLLAQRQAFLAPVTGGGHDAKGQLVGWEDQDKGRLYLHPVAAHKAVVEFGRQSNEPFTMSRDRLEGDLAKEGLLVERERGRNQIRIQVAGAGRPRVLALDKARVEELVGEGVWDETDQAEG
jgi:hypothetical protein